MLKLHETNILEQMKTDRRKKIESCCLDVFKVFFLLWTMVKSLRNTIWDIIFSCSKHLEQIQIWDDKSCNNAIETFHPYVASLLETNYPCINNVSVPKVHLSCSMAGRCLATVLPLRALVFQALLGCWAKQPNRFKMVLTWPVAKRLKPFGITYLIGKIKFKLFFSGSIG